MSHVFVSYVREDKEQVDKLCKELQSFGITVWLDREKIRPGQRWRRAIKSAIRDGAFFIACFSEAYENKSRTYMNEELIEAVNIIRQFPLEQSWFLPILLSPCKKIPDYNIAPGETLRDIQWIDLQEDWEGGIERIIEEVKSLEKNPENFTEQTKGIEHWLNQALVILGYEGEKIIETSVILLEDAQRDGFTRIGDGEGVRYDTRDTLVRLGALKAIKNQNSFRFTTHYGITERGKILLSALKGRNRKMGVTNIEETSQFSGPIEVINVPNGFTERYGIRSGPMTRLETPVPNKKNKFLDYGVIFTTSDNPSSEAFDTNDLLSGAVIEATGLPETDNQRLFTIIGGYFLESLSMQNELRVKTTNVFGIALDHEKGFFISEGGNTILADHWKLIDFIDNPSRRMDERKFDQAGWTFIVKEVRSRSKYPTSGFPIRIWRVS